MHGLPLGRLSMIISEASTIWLKIPQAHMFSDKSYRTIDLVRLRYLRKWM